MTKSKILRSLMMRKTKAVLIDMLEEQRQLIVKANDAKDEEARRVIRKQSMINTLQNEASQADAKYEHLLVKHENMLRDKCRQENELETLKAQVIDTQAKLIKCLENDLDSIFTGES